jgi:hypothetical protein
MSMTVAARDKLLRHITETPDGHWLWHGPVQIEIGGRDMYPARASLKVFRDETPPVATCVVKPRCGHAACVRPECLVALPRKAAIDYGWTRGSRVRRRKHRPTEVQPA